MAQIIPMPKLSDTMSEGVLRKWHKKEGDKIAAGDLLAEIETDKATMDFESFDSGVLLKRLVDDGATVPVNAPIAIFGQAGEDVSAAVSEAQGQKAGAAKSEAPKAERAGKPEPKDAGEDEPAAKAEPAAPEEKDAESERAAPKAPPRPAGSVPRSAAPPALQRHPVTGPTAKILASPLARKLAAELGVDLRTLRGSGPGGRIVERDVKIASEGGMAEEAPAPRPSAPAPAPSPQARPSDVPRADGSLAHPIFPDRRQEARPASWSAPGEDQTIPLSMMRKTIARRLVESKTQIPHFYLTADADMEAVMAFRGQVKEVHGAKLSVNDLVIKAAALALRRVPECNAAWSDEGVVRFARVDIGMAVAVEDGLLTPVIRSADVKTLGQISAEAQELAQRARDRKLKPEDMTGGTFSVSNLGMMGIKDFCAIINPPEAAILAVGAVRKEPVVKNDQIVVGQRMSLTLSCDHRVIDGALGARLLSAIVTVLERPITLAF